MRERLGLLAHGPEEAGMAVTERRDPPRGVAVDVPPAVDVLEPDALGAGDDDGILGLPGVHRRVGVPDVGPVEADDARAIHGRGGYHGGMALETVRVSAVLPATADRIYAAWLDCAEHTRMTGGKAIVEPARRRRAQPRGTATSPAQMLELEPGRRIVQTWRSTDFPLGAPDSRLEVHLREVEGGCEVAIIHTEIPEGQGAQYEEGWREHYLAPMPKYFGKRAARPARKKAAAKKAPKRVSGKKAPSKAKRPAARKAAKKRAAKKPARRAKRGK